MYRLLNAIPSYLNRHNEERVLSALKSPEFSHWVRTARRADGLLKSGGIDVVVTTDRKDILLQIKPNYTWANALKGYIRYRPVAIIVCDNSTSDAHLRMRISEGLEHGYNRS